MQSRKTKELIKTENRLVAARGESAGTNDSTTFQLNVSSGDVRNGNYG